MKSLTLNHSRDINKKAAKETARMHSRKSRWLTIGKKFFSAFLNLFVVPETNVDSRICQS